MAPKHGPIFIMDNGAYTIKAGLSSEDAAKPRILYNAAIRSKGDAKLYIGQDFDACEDYLSLTYRLPFERGYLTDWDVEKAVWDNLFGPNGFSLDLKSTSALVTEPPFNLHSIQEKYDQLIFEEYEFASYVRCPGAILAPYGTIFPGQPFPECSLIVDSGFSFTHVIPVMKGSILWDGVRRIDVGGKVLTNQLASIISFNHYYVLDQTYIVNDMKEKCCHVSSSFANDLERCRSNKATMTLEYVLPDLSRNQAAYTRKPSTTEPFNPARALASNMVTGSEQVIPMATERFSIPELLFNPSDIGFSQAGLPQAIAYSISVLPEELQGLFWANIGLIGGNVLFPKFSDRLRQDLRALAPVEYELGIYEADDPITATYRAANAFANSADFATFSISKEEYNEGGSNACRRKFKAFDWDPAKEKPVQPRPSRNKVEAKAVEESDENVTEEETPKAARKMAPRRREKPGVTKTRRNEPRKK